MGSITPVLSVDIQNVVALLSLQHSAPSTIATYVAGVGYFHKMNGWLDPTKDYLVAKLLEGCRRDRPSKDRRLPITLPVLTSLLEALPYVCFSQYESSTFKAVLLCACFGFCTFQT